ncbi:MAG: GSCFA domain-containing protein [Bacteroidaceae bacterium]|nr:GSCFA domain-containing protein [Bacteroidaceae bacterium]
MRFTTRVQLPTDTIHITHSTQIMLLGSCFVQNIGERMQGCKLSVDVNPFGVLYNPFSIAAALRRIVSGEPYGSSSPEFFEYNGCWHSMMHHSAFSRGSREEAVEAANGRLLAAHRRFGELDVLMLTFGTAYVYRSAADGSVVGNCHKLPQKMFVRELLTVDAIVGEMSTVIGQMLAARPTLKILLTVSPIRHLRDGAHDNQISKATLLLAVEELRRRFPGNTFYFPSYEIVLDELRDYRFFADDMVHPSTVAVEYLWECFAECYFDTGTKRLNDAVDGIMRALAHRPADAASERHKAFLQKTVEKMVALKKENPVLDFEKEIQQCNILLEK